jgi:hypothetical protein
MTGDPIAAGERLMKALHPEDYDNSKINSSAFNPSEEHEFMLSVDRLTLSSPQQTFDRYVQGGRKSIGVCGVHASDFASESIPCNDDPIEGNPSHALADYREHSGNQRRKKARRLAEAARNYGLDFAAS